MSVERILIRRGAGWQQATGGKWSFSFVVFELECLGPNIRIRMHATAVPYNNLARGTIAPCPIHHTVRHATTALSPIESVLAAVLASTRLTPIHNI